MSRFGVDYAWGYRPGLENDLKAAGVTFAARYISHDSSKDENLAEAEALARAGIDSVLVFESTATEAEGGYAAGLHDAQFAAQRLSDLKVPHDRPCFWAVDEDTTVGPNITAYSAAFDQVLRGLHGPYGSYQIVKAAFDHLGVKWGWQTYAWSNGLWEPRAQLRQYSNGHSIGGVSCDYDTAQYADFGQWKPLSVVPPAPPAPKPAPKPVGPQPPRDVEGPWPYSSNDYLSTESSDPYCHSGYYHRDAIHVAAYQHQLQVRGWKIAITGRFDAQTLTITEAFQAEKKITKDGKVGPVTWNHARHDPVT